MAIAKEKSPFDFMGDYRGALRGCCCHPKVGDFFSHPRTILGGASICGAIVPLSWVVTFILGVLGLCHLVNLSQSASIFFIVSSVLGVLCCASGYKIKDYIGGAGGLPGLPSK